jgi:type I restriction enzyme M protein
MSKRKNPQTPEVTLPLTPQRDGNGKIWSYVRHAWKDETPEERVRQEYLCTLVNEYGYSLEQIAEEIDVTGHRGAGRARADFIIWRTAQDKTESNSPLVIVECKADNVTIKEHDYFQGESYARMTDAPFFVTHNHRETKYWRVVRGKMPKTLEEIENIPHAEDTDKQIDELLKRLKVFKEDEFAKLLHDCHNVIRNREKLDPAAAFDEIAKVLFVKVWVEREMRDSRRRENRFTVEVLDRQIGKDPLNLLFQQTKDAFEEDRIFKADESIKLKPATSREIVKKLERYNLSETSEDIKGIAFERFLGRTFRGEIGQFFTPRTIVEFIIRMVEPEEGDVICDPASGSGGFLIRFFEIVRQQILADVDKEYRKFETGIDALKISEEEKAKRKLKKYDELQQTLDPTREGSRLWELANRCIYGTDANERMARTSKMNMIMHGDGHGGVHYHDGFLNVNGIFEGRFDIVLTNPPFGASVEESDVVLEEQAKAPPKLFKQYAEDYGEIYKEAQARVRAAIGEPIASLFELPKNEDGKVSGKTKTEILFIERCLDLLKPGGRLGIVLPEGIFNNPSLAYVREFCEDRAFIRAVVSLPQETFYSSGASVKASLLFMRKFDEKEKTRFESTKRAAETEIDEKYAPEIETETARLQKAIDEAKEKREKEPLKTARKELKDYIKLMESKKKAEARALLKERFSYPVFLYEAEKVGITATGEPDQNELYPNESRLQGVEKTCLELYREFIENPEPFFAQSIAEAR